MDNEAGSINCNNQADKLDMRMWRHRRLKQRKLRDKRIIRIGLILALITYGLIFYYGRGLDNLNLINWVNIG